MRGRAGTCDARGVHAAGQFTRRAVHAAWRAAGARDDRAFRAALRQPAAAQARVLDRLLRAARRTAFGREHELAAVRGAAAFRAAVPPRTYDELRPWILRAASGEPRVLTRARVLRLLPTSGSAGAVKLVPWTATLSAEFLAAVRPWLAAVHRRHPAARRGAVYWSLSPPGPAPAVPGAAVPVGFASDASYLGTLGRFAFRRLQAVPPQTLAAPDPAGFWRATALRLLAACDLAFVSVWSPTFLSVLLAEVRGAWLELLGPLAAENAAGRARAAALRRAFGASGPGPGTWRAVWPGLAAVSCWTDGPSEGPARALADELGGVPIDPKGLLSTEAVVSLPYAAGTDPVPALRSHFLEFLEEGGNTARGVEDLEAGGVYEAVVTTGGGLYRYRTGDLVRVTGRAGAVPTLRFAGRGGAVSDLCGEKLTEPFAREAVAAALRDAGADASFALLAPEGDGAFRYVLFVAPAAPLSGAQPLAAALDARLRAGFQYDVARRLGQLGAPRVFRIDTARCRPDAVFLAEMERRGRRRGDAKPAALDREGGWQDRFAGTWR